MQIIPLRALPSQQVQSQVNGQACTINVYQQAFGLFFDLYVGSADVVLGSICQDRNKLVRGSIGAISTPGFVGDFAFVDTQGAEDPVYTGLGARWQLVYSADGGFDD